ncbi:MAG: Rpn family recombination-promoting nuclease/putative transposase [Oscillospiraceae bacterium]|nr:Rpn family recombination-promoting nuclease/putative transposase [Oscillospiraceae bacterium]
MAEKFISAKLDIVFKMLFAAEENKDILEAFLSDILDIPRSKLRSVRVKNPEIDPKHIDEKYYRLDLNIDVGDQMINVEMQVYYDAFYGARTILYWSKQYSSQLSEGEDYSKLCVCISVNIMDYIVFKNHDDYHSRFGIWDVEHNNKLTDMMDVHFFELKKVKGELDKNDRKKLWLQFLKAETKEEFAMLENIGVPAIEKAVQAIYTMSADEKKKEDIRMREKALHDEASLLLSAEIKGRTEGIEAMIAGMRLAGISEEQIEAAKKAMRNE